MGMDCECVCLGGGMVTDSIIIVILVHTIPPEHDVIPSHFPAISYNYPDEIKQRHLRTQIGFCNVCNTQC